MLLGEISERRKKTMSRIRVFHNQKKSERGRKGQKRGIKRGIGLRERDKIGKIEENGEGQ